ncbi:MAG: hypothetical protein PF590_00025 [Candidatus Delongbacteria bacterium]|jgi:hypothetical protein|nr:hypothetical protein [Candidatus Delongbacteria bacterium]
MKTTLSFAMIILLVSVLFTSCHSKKEKEAMNKIVGLLQQNKEINQTLNGRFFDSVNAYHDSLAQMHEFFTSREIETFPESPELRQAFHQTSNAAKILGHYKSRHLEKFNEKITTSTQQLEDLKHDIDNNLLEDSLIDNYLQKEDSAAQLLQKRAHELLDFTRQQLSVYSENKDEVNNLKTLIKEKDTPEE